MNQSTTCVINGCDRPEKSRGLCNRHYLREQRGGRLDAWPLTDKWKPPVACSVDQCDRPAKTRGWCGAHYQRNQRFGSPTGGARPVKRIEWPLCAIEDCRKPANDSGERVGVGLCIAHLERSRKHGSPFVKLPRVPKQCLAVGCERGCIAENLCGMHYQRKQKHGDPNAKPLWAAGVRKPPLPHQYVYLWMPDREGNERQIAEHRYVMEQQLGRRLHSFENVHHINGDRHDNRPENLELWTTAQPPGQKVTDKIEYALEILNRYAPHLLA